MSEERAVLFDVNALVALALTTHQHHRSAHSFLADRHAWATCPATESALIRMLLNPLITGTQRQATEAVSIIEGMRTDPRWRFVSDRTSLADPQVNTSVLMGHRQVTDLHLVNLAACNNVVLATFDAGIVTWLAPHDRRHVVVIPA